MHLGSGSGIYTLHPYFVRTVVAAIQKAGGRPFVTDGTSAFFDAYKRGYTHEVLGCPVPPADGVADRYFLSRPGRLRDPGLCGAVRQYRGCGRSACAFA